MLLDLTIYLIWILAIGSIMAIIFKRQKASLQQPKTLPVEVKYRQPNQRQVD